MVIFKNLPVPPSINKSYMSVRRGRRSTIISTTELRDFKIKMWKYEIKNRPMVLESRAQVKAWIEGGQVLCFNLFVFFERERIETKTKKAKAKFKRVDADNRLKAMRDAIAELLQIDDSFFFSGNTEKAIGVESCLVQITPTTVRTKEEIMRDLEAPSA